MLKNTFFKRILFTALVTGFLFLGLSLFGEVEATGEIHEESFSIEDFIEQEGLEDDDTVEVIIRLTHPDKDQLQAMKDIQGREGVFNLLRLNATYRQRQLNSRFEEELETVNNFWVSNAVLAELKVADLEKIAQWEGVEAIHQNFEVNILDDFEVSGEEEMVEVEGHGVTWGIGKIRAPETWNDGFTGSGVKVAVIDSGVDMSHRDLEGRMHTDNPGDSTYPGGWMEFDLSGNRVNSEPHETHSDSHGTHVSGTVVGGNRGGTGIGVAPDATLMHGLALPGGGGSFAQVVSAMEWAVEEGADVVNMSFGFRGYAPQFVEPIQNIISSGAIPVVAIGNDGHGTFSSPGVIYESFAVGAIDSGGRVANFSGGVKGDDQRADTPSPYVKPDFTAPGVSVMSSVSGNRYQYYQGTSMAAPHVAGTIALMLEADSSATERDIYNALKQTANYKSGGTTLGEENKNTRYGYGIIDTKKAVDLLLDNGHEPEPPSPEEYTLEVTSDDGGSTSPSEGTYSYEERETVTVTASARRGYEFTGWSGDCTGTTNTCSVIMTENKQVHANFEEEDEPTPPEPDIEKPTVTTLEGDFQIDSGQNFNIIRLNFNGRLDDSGKANGADVWFEWSSSETDLSRTTTREEKSARDNFSASRSIISSRTTFYFRAVAENEAGTSYGDIKVIDISEEDEPTPPEPDIEKPTVETNRVTEIEDTSALLSGSVVDIGGEENMLAYFEWRRRGSYESSHGSVFSSPDDWNWRLTGLQPDTDYEYRFVGENDAGTSYGVTRTFTTEPEEEGADPDISPPRISTDEPINIREDQASVRGRLTDLGGADEVETWFDWGTSARRLTNSTPTRTFTDSTTHQRNLLNLEPDTTYYYRFVAENEAALSAGSVASFTTKPEEEEPEPEPEESRVRVFSGMDGRTVSGVEISRISGPRGIEGVTNYEYSSTGDIEAVLRAPETHEGAEFDRWLRCDNVRYRDCTVRVSEGSTQTIAVYYTTPEDEPEPDPEESELTVRSRIERVHDDWMDRAPLSGVSIGSRLRGGDIRGETPYTYKSSEEIDDTLRAPETHEGAEFDRWSGCGSVSDRDCVVNIPTGNSKTITAYYRKVVEEEPEPEPDVEKPTVTTFDPLQIDERRAFIRYSLRDLGGAEKADAWFEWGKTEDLGNTTSANTFDQPRSYSEALHSLEPGTTYYYRAVAENEAGTSYGDIVSFSTEGDPDPEEPVVKTLPGEFYDIEHSTGRFFLFILNGEIMNSGEYEARFEWGTTEDLGNETDPKMISDNLREPLLQTEKSDIYFRAVAQNEAGTSYGDIKVITVPEEEPEIEKPEVATLDAETEIDRAHFFGRLESTGGAEEVDVRFEWVGFDLVKGDTRTETMTSAGDFDAETDGLTPGTTYLVRAIAENEKGVATGSIKVFNTESEDDPEEPDDPEELQEYILEITSDEGGSTEPEEGAHTYEEGESVVITAIADDGYRFIGWDGDCSGTNESCSLTVTENKSIHANFEEEVVEIDSERPALRTRDVLHTGPTSAAISGEVENLGGKESVSVWFEWGESEDLGNRTDESEIDRRRSHSRVLRDLESGTYYYRIVGENQAGKSHGDIVSFEIN